MGAGPVIVLGGSGVFGSRVARSLREAGIEVIIAGRRDFTFGRSLRADARTPDGIATLMAVRPSVIVDAAGPFHTRDIALPRQCAAAGIHYVDLADDRTRVAVISELDGLARAHDVLIVAGASTVPAITTAIVDDLVGDPSSVSEIDVGISPGHLAPRGLATVRAILRYCGKPVPRVEGGAEEFGWGGLGRYEYPAPVGRRWLSNVDTPERALWRSRYPSLRNGRIRAGLEIAALHFALTGLSRLVRVGLLGSLVPLAPAMLRTAEAFDRYGSDTGAMHVRVVSATPDGKRAAHLGTLVAGRGDGPQIPAAPSAVLVKKLLGVSGHAPCNQRGALACMGLITIEEILTELRSFSIQYASLKNAT